MSDSSTSYFDIQTLLRDNIRRLQPYNSARDDFQGAAQVYLDANENPYPSAYNRYPDPHQHALKEKIADLKGVSPEQIFLGNGSDEAIDLLIRAFCEPHVESILTAEPTYGMYAVCAHINAVQVQKVLLNELYDIELDRIGDVVNNSTKIIFLCSPNNPTGNLLNSEAIHEILDRFYGLVVVDEAYIDFVPGKSFLPFLHQYPNLVVLQTFSKAWGLAGLRLGMCFANKAVIRILNKIKYPYNLNAATLNIVADALDQPFKKDIWVEEIVRERDRLARALLQIRIVERVYPSDANFLLVRVRDAQATYRALMAEQIIVRDRSQVELCRNCLRITVGTPREDDLLLFALGNL